MVTKEMMGKATVSLLIDNDFRALIPPLSPEEYSELEQSLISEGNRVPIDTWNGYIVDGHNRYDICHNHKIPLKPPNQLNLKYRDDVKIWIIDNQLARRNLVPAARIELAIKKNDIKYQKEARERLIESGKQYHKGNSKVTQTYGEPVPHEQEVDAKIGKDAGVSRETVRKYRHIKKNANQKQQAKLLTGETSINETYKASEPKNEAQSKRMALKFERLQEIEKNGIYIGINSSQAIPNNRGPYSGNGEYFYSLLKDIRRQTGNSIIFILDTSLPDDVKIQELREMSQMLLEE